MIVSCTAPAGAQRVRYGACEMLVDDDGKIDVPAFVAKTLVAKAGFTCSESLSQTAARLMEDGGEQECSYIFQAYGRPMPHDQSIKQPDQVISHEGETDPETGAPVPDELVPVPDVVENVDRLALALALLAKRGEPSASVS